MPNLGVFSLTYKTCILTAIVEQLGGFPQVRTLLSHMFRIQGFS